MRGRVAYISDRLCDGDEVNLFNTDPTNADSDGDGFPDGTEITDATDPNNPTPTPAGSRPRGPLSAGSPMRRATARTHFSDTTSFGGAFGRRRVSRMADEPPHVEHSGTIELSAGYSPV
jgi:Bacterial TSP3 repeat